MGETPERTWIWEQHPWEHGPKGQKPLARSTGQSPWLGWQFSDKDLIPVFCSFLVHLQEHFHPYSFNSKIYEFYPVEYSICTIKILQFESVSWLSENPNNSFTSYSNNAKAWLCTSSIFFMFWEMLWFDSLILCCETMILVTYGMVLWKMTFTSFKNEKKNYYGFWDITKLSRNFMNTSKILGTISKILRKLFHFYKNLSNKKHRKWEIVAIKCLKSDT